MAKFIYKLLVLTLVLPSAAFGAADNGTAPGLTAQQLREQLTVFAYHDVREDIKREYAADQYAMSAENLAMHFAWLRDNGYNVVSLEQVLAATSGRRPLPPKAVLLTFDDGLASVYTTAYPLLKLFDYPALVSVVTSWIETEVEVVYENHLLSSRDFLTWEQMREMQDSGLSKLFHIRMICIAVVSVILREMSSRWRLRACMRLITKTLSSIWNGLRMTSRPVPA